MDFEDNRHFKDSGIDYFSVSDFYYYSHSEPSLIEFFKDCRKQISNHQGKHKDHIIVLVEACCAKYDHITHGFFPDLNAYDNLLDWIESKSGRPLGNHSVLVFHNVGEAFQGSCDYHFCKLLLDKYPELTLVLCSGSSHGKITTRTVKKLYGAYKNFYHICNNDWYESFGPSTDLSRKPDYLKNYPKEKTFLCIGGGLRWHRKLLMYNLYHNNLMDHGFVGYDLPSAYSGSGIDPDRSIQSYDADIYDLWVERDIKNKLPSYMSLYENKDMNSGDFPVLSDNGNAHAWLNIPDLDFPYYEDSYVTLLPETSWWSGHAEYFRKCFVDFEHIDYSAPSNFFSEKTYRAILNGMPFVMLNAPHSLDSLRNMGFETYHPYIDETYDTIEDDQDRMASLIQTLLKIRDNPPDRATLEKINEIADYNRNHYLSNRKILPTLTDNQGIEIGKLTNTF